jgi:hypothetical protein
MTAKIDTRTNDEQKILLNVRAAMKRFVRNKNLPEEMETLRFNLIVARALQGYSAVEAAERFGYKNSTQISLIESGERPIPKDHRFIRQAAEVYKVSCDFLLGLSPHMEPDSLVARQFAMMRGMEDILRRDAAMRTTAMIQYTEQTQPTEQDFKRAESAMTDICKAVKVMQEKFGFDEIRGGAPVIAAVERCETALMPLRSKLAQFKGIEDIFAEFRTGSREPIPYLMERYNQRDLLAGI